jgi:hypothetical protein
VSNENPQNPADGAATDNDNALEPRKSESFEISVGGSGQELVFKDATTGRELKLRLPTPKQPERKEHIPLTPDQFRDGLQRLKALGFEWTADQELSLRAKDDASENAFFSEEYRSVQADYPNLPPELSAVVFYALTGRPAPPPLVGGKDILEKKVEIVREIVIDADYSSEFFFKRATKVPYFSRIDWEVVIKTFERNVDGPLSVPYALLSLYLENPESDEDEGITVAANLELLDELIESLIEVKSALETTREVSRGVFDSLHGKEGGINAPAERKESE